MPGPARPTGQRGSRVHAGRARDAGARARVNDVLQRMLTSVPERAEAALEARLTAVPAMTRCTTVAVASSEGGVGKTMCAFVAGTLLADRSRLRVLAIDADARRGTLPLLLADRLRSDRSAADLIRELDAVESAVELRRFVSIDRSGLHVLAGPVEESAFGTVLHLCERFYEVVLLDLGTGLTNPFARRALQRAHHLIMVSTSDWATSMSVTQSLAAWRAGAGRQRAAPTLVLNRMTEDADQHRVALQALDSSATTEIVTIPHDPQLALMLDTGTFGLGALARRTRVAARRLGVAVLGHLG
jgi:MinD-like ATPase involved in chromosome partitioning or flagellar assembly